MTHGPEPYHDASGGIPKTNRRMAVSRFVARSRPKVRVYSPAPLKPGSRSSRPIASATARHLYASGTSGRGSVSKKASGGGGEEAKFRPSASQIIRNKGRGIGSKYSKINYIRWSISSVRGGHSRELALGGKPCTARRLRPCNPASHRESERLPVGMHRGCPSGETDRTTLGRLSSRSQVGRIQPPDACRA